MRSSVKYLQRHKYLPFYLMSNREQVKNAVNLVSDFASHLILILSYLLSSDVKQRGVKNAIVSKELTMQ